jgi:hypothetical protein
VTAGSSSRWAGSITKASHDPWALARRAQAAHLASLDAAIAMVCHRLSVPVGQKGTKKVAGGYRSRREWHAKSRRLAALRDRRAKVAADAAAGRVHVVRGGKKLAKTRHHLEAAGLSVAQWRGRWEADRVAARRAVAYTLTLDPRRGRWYVTACWQPASIPHLSLEAALVAGCVGVDTNNDHLAAWHLDIHGNPGRRPPKVRLRPVRDGVAPGRADPPRSDPSAALGAPVRGGGHRDRAPGLRW